MGGKVLSRRLTTTLNFTPIASSWVALVPILPGEPISSANSRTLFLTSILRFLIGLLKMPSVRMHASLLLVSMFSSLLAMHSVPTLVSKSVRKLTVLLKSWYSLLLANCLKIRLRASAKLRKHSLQRDAVFARLLTRLLRLSTRHIN